jgi:hypothetical protein
MSNDHTQKAIVNARQALADLFTAAMATLDATEAKQRVQAAIERRAVQAGAAETGAELAFACIIVAQKGAKPSGVELVTDTESVTGASDSKRAVSQMVRRIKDSL